MGKAKRGRFFFCVIDLDTDDNPQFIFLIKAILIVESPFLLSFYLLCICKLSLHKLGVNNAAYQG